MVMIEETRRRELCPFKWPYEDPVIEKLVIIQDFEFEKRTNYNKIILVVEGAVDVKIGIKKMRRVYANEMFYVAFEQKIKIKSASQSIILFFRFQNNLKFCNCFSLDKIAISIRKKLDRNYQRADVYILNVPPIIKNNLFLILDYENPDFSCNYYFQLKLDELLFMLGKLYPTEHLALFFKESLSDDTAFSECVRKNALKNKTVKELAQSMHYSVSGFEKRFKRVFKLSPYKWMKVNKAQRIYYDLSMTNKSLKDIEDDYGFKSVNYFYDFCKNNLGATPHTIRKNKGGKLKR